MQPLSQRWIGRMMKSHRMALLLLTATLAVADDVTPLFDGRTLAGWSVIEFGGEGAVKVLPDGVLEIGAGTQLSGLVNTNPPRRIDYELSLEGRRVEGSDFFCGLTFPVPIFADESCHVAADVPALMGLYQGVNIKLDKTGGLTEALRARDEARRLGLRVMVGCMISTSLSMAPAILVAQGADWSDLDGPADMAEDRAHPVRYDDRNIHPAAPELWG